MQLLQIFFYSDFVGKLILITLLVFSIFSWSIIFQKIFLFFINYQRSKELKDYLIQNTIVTKKIVTKILADPSMHYELYIKILIIYENNLLESQKDQKTEETFENVFNQWEVEFSKNLEYLSVIGSISPFIGLFGTVLGIIHSFQAIAASNTNSISVVAPALSEALYVTALGIFVAIPANMAANIFYAKIDLLKKDLNLFKIFLTERFEKSFGKSW